MTFNSSINKFDNFEEFLHNEHKTFMKKISNMTNNQK